MKENGGIATRSWRKICCPKSLPQVQPRYPSSGHSSKVSCPHLSCRFLPILCGFCDSWCLDTDTLNKAKDIKKASCIHEFWCTRLSVIWGCEGILFVLLLAPDTAQEFCHSSENWGCNWIRAFSYSYSIRASIYCVLSVHEMEYLVCLFQLFHLVQRFFWIFGDILLTCVI